ncbi:hypothetical protein FSARC_4079 [Fusarium sarcochroum]|uniref:Uncharacterized protein n=1 Tax=Fusarium sarcochroum TaxID=1208366 RepID=A0A8H4U2L8_9HYPO|nr:hypothetical protein FSARC_4079 [Fusarium sarcochroum]
MAKPLASYSLARVLSFGTSQQLVYISGCTARATDGTIPPFGLEYDETLLTQNDKSKPSPAAIQTEAIFNKIASTIYDISEGAAGLETLVEITIFVKDLNRDYASMNMVYNERIGHLFTRKGLSLPARTCVQVSAMPPDERTLVEIKGVAEIHKL